MIPWFFCWLDRAENPGAPDLTLTSDRRHPPEILRGESLGSTWIEGKEVKGMTLKKKEDHTFKMNVFFFRCRGRWYFSKLCSKYRCLQISKTRFSAIFTCIGFRYLHCVPALRAYARQVLMTVQSYVSWCFRNISEIQKQQHYKTTTGENIHP